MNNITININEAAVTAIHEFKTFKGYGVDFYIEAKSSNSTEYFQVVVYDDIARSYSSRIHEGDTVRIKGDLKVKVYKKKDGSDGFSLLIERPELFEKVASGNSSPQLPQNTVNRDEAYTANNNQEMNAISASAVTADSSNSDSCQTRNTQNLANNNATAEETMMKKHQDCIPTGASLISVDETNRLITFAMDGEKFECYYSDEEEDYDSGLPF